MEQDLDSISAVFIIKKDGALLLQLRDDNPAIHRPGYWVIPGGHCKLGESTLECARREILEETLYICNRLKYIDTILDNDNDYKYWLHMYWEVYDERQPITCMEGQKLAFVNRVDAGEYIKLDFLLTYWDKVIDLLEKEIS